MADYTLMIAATTGVCSYVAGIVTMGLVSARKVARLRDDLFYAECDLTLAEDMLKVEKEANRRMGRELAEYRASRQRSTAPLKVANAARKAKRLEREAAAVALRNARHAEMRQLVGEVI